MKKINNKDFIRAVSADTGFTQKDIADVLNSAANVVLNNLKNGIETAVFQGMVVYPSSYKGKDNEVTFPRARFGKFFKSLSLA